MDISQPSVGIHKNLLKFPNVEKVIHFEIFEHENELFQISLSTLYFHEFLKRKTDEHKAIKV